jgi:uncharacterized membrane protein YgcG
VSSIYKSARAGFLPALLLVFSCAAPPAQADERILSYDSTITVNQDGTLQVSESIRVRAEGRNIKRGIYRDFPTTYPRADGGSVTVGFAFEGATRDGADEPWHTQDQGNGVRVYLGSPSSYLSEGEHSYVLSYRTDRQMGFFSDHDELYWNVTGNGWAFPIDHASAHILLPDGIPRGEIRMEAYTGPQGSKGQDFSSGLDDGAPVFRTTRGLESHEGLTIVAMWPKGFIMPAVESTQPLRSPSASPGYDYSSTGGAAEKYFDSPAEAFLHHDLPRDNRPVIFGLLGLLLLLTYYYFVWDRVGRDPPGRVIIPEYQMPKNLSAAAVRYLMQMGYDNKCFAAGILSLAVKGYLGIEQSSGILGIGKKFTLTRSPDPAANPLPDDEQRLLASLFKAGDALELEQENHSRVNGARVTHQRALDSGYQRGFFAINGGWHLLGIAMSIGIIVVTLAQPGAALVWPQWYLHSPLGWFTVACAIGALVANGVFGRLLRAPTITGQTAMDHIRGFKMYLEVAEGEELKRIVAPPPKLTPQLYEAYLPAALALEVEQRWAERFARELALQPTQYQPAWYTGPGWNSASIAGFSSELGSSLSSAISSASQAPGSSSGGGGGGSSGGGGGGGGGGGW